MIFAQFRNIMRYISLLQGVGLSYNSIIDNQSLVGNTLYIFSERV